MYWVYLKNVLAKTTKPIRPFDSKKQAENYVDKQIKNWRYSGLHPSNYVGWLYIVDYQGRTVLSKSL